MAELRMSDKAASHWSACYAELTQDYSGPLGSVTSRAEAQVVRLAMGFAQFDGTQVIEFKHLEAALTFWRYAFDSAEYIFKGAEIDPAAKIILDAIDTGPKTQNDIVNLFGRHMPKDRLSRLLKGLQDRGRVTLKIEKKTGGRPRSVWTSTRAR
jgi:hypothetical protein